MNVLSLFRRLVARHESVPSIPEALVGYLVRLPRGICLMLDIDGVLHPAQSGSLRHMAVFERWMLEHPSVDVVISSTWRETCSFVELQALFPESIRDRIIGTTPVLEGRLREEEIALFVRHHGITQWFCVDDQIGDFPTMRDARLVATEYIRGITPDTLVAMSLHVEASFFPYQSQPCRD